jgi:ABC-type dipeptide/oligopeptide/nickel transport system permease component
VIRLVLNRLLGMVIATIGASFLAFAFMRVLPGNPARLILGPLVPQKSVNQLAHDMGLDQSIPIQYWRYMRGFFTGDWGFSYSTGLSVWTVIWQRLPATLELDVYGFVFGTSLAFALALAATYRRRPLIDRLVRGIAYLGLGTPPFWLGLLLLITLSERWKIFPGPDGRLSPTATAPPDVTGFYTIDALVNGDLSTFRDALAHLILPAFTLGFLLFAVLVRLLRANLLGVEREHFLLVVKSKGVSRWLAFRRHALPNAVLPTITAAGLLFAELLTGSVLVERVFNWPGAGGLVVDSIQRKDYSVVQTFILLSAIAYVVINAIVDLAYLLIDPRTRLPGATRG